MRADHARSLDNGHGDSGHVELETSRNDRLVKGACHIHPQQTSSPQRQKSDLWGRLPKTKIWSATSLVNQRAR